MPNYELETFSGCQPSVLRQRFAACKVGRFIKRQIDFERVAGRDIVNLDQRPSYTPALIFTEIREVSPTLRYILYAFIQCNDACLNKIEALLRGSAVEVQADQYEEMPEEQKLQHFYDTPFSMHALGADGGVDFKTPATLRVIQPEVLDPHLEEFERRAHFNVLIYRSGDDGGPPEIIVPIAQEFRRGNEHNSMLHNLFRQIENDLGI